MPPTLQRAVVVDVITDPDLMTDEELSAIMDTVNNAELIDIMPINSIIGRISNNSAGGKAQPNTILLPFFSSHIMLPVQPGETVYVIYEDYHDTGAALGYWFTRIGGAKTVEDVNYTHRDRCFDPSTNPANYSTEERARIDGGEGASFPGPSFPNGGNSDETLTLEFDSVADTVIEPFEQIKQESKSYKLATIEPVPRFRKRPQELAFQGSNNTLIRMGEDRGGPVSSTDDAKGQAGTVDVVVGRARTTPVKTESTDGVPNSTNPRVIQNTRGDFETDKAPHRRSFQRKDNPEEGNPDFKDDAARLYVTMQSEVDRRFNLSLNSENSLALPEIAGKDGTFNRSHIVGKADHVRLVARKDVDNGIEGTILLIREGEVDEDLGYFFIDETGKIQIESEKIYLGESTDEREPYVLWSRFNETRNQLQMQIDEVTKQMDVLTSKLKSAMGTAIGNLGAPIPSLVSTASTIKQPSDDLARNIVPLKKRAITESAHDSQSKKIFGE
jgi:hypothetical protein